MRWMKIGPACEYLGGINPKTLYAAVRAGQCQAGEIGAGRNLLFCDEWLDEYAKRPKKTPTAVRESNAA
jgi:hypothetical protein